MWLNDNTHRQTIYHIKENYIMSVCEKVFVTCGKENLVEVIDSAIDALNKYSRSKLDVAVAQSGANNRYHFLNNIETFSPNLKIYSNGVKLSGFDLRILSLTFGCGDDILRAVSVCTMCDSDYSDVYDGEKIIFSINHWGSSAEIMNVVSASLLKFGDVYYCKNDCSEDFVKLTHG